MKPGGSLELAALSDPGLVRSNNEDCYLVALVERGLRTLMTNLPSGSVPDHHSDTGHVLLVADGMGGAAAGEVASRTAVSILVGLALETPDWVLSLEGEHGRQVLARTEERFHKIKDVFLDLAKTDSSLTGMGTTMTVAGIVGENLMIAHVGDSRASLFRGGRLLHLTRDQTMAQMLADAGEIRPEEVATHRLRHVLTGAITTEKGEVPAEMHLMRLLDGDQILLSTDGLTEMVSDEKIAETLRRPGTAEQACRALVDLALEGGGKDNVTVVLARYGVG
jgi:PPM family protein phosphatase